MNHSGYYGMFGGCYIPETLFATMERLTGAFHTAKNDPAFWDDYRA